MSKKIVILGGGPAGIEAARAAVSAGARVTLVTDSPVGGRSGWSSLLPSKVWLTTGDTFGLMSEAEKLGLTAEGGKPNPGAVLARIKAVKETWNSRQLALLTTAGVEIITGVGAFTTGREVTVKNSAGDEIAYLRSDAVIIAGGSVPVFPPALRPDGKRVIAPRMASNLDWLPQSVVVIGGGPTGTETVYLFNRLGAKVTWVVNPSGVLPHFAREAGQFVAEVFTRRGVQLVWNSTAERIDRAEDGVTVVLTDGAAYPAEMAFVAIGRAPDVSRLNLEVTGAMMNGNAPQVDALGRTSVPGIYAVGDVTGAPMLANRAMAQAWVAGKHAAGAEVTAFREETVIHAIYSEPQVAQVGRVEGNGLRQVRLEFADGLKQHLLSEGDGFVTLALNSARQVTGGVAVGPHAADVLAPVAVAIQMNATVDDLAPIFAAHPTLSELPFAAARLAS
jgi:dihydrolipoamide dehydrogenase